MWQNQFLENERKRDRYFGVEDEKTEADKAIILQRMLV